MCTRVPLLIVQNACGNHVVDLKAYSPVRPLNTVFLIAVHAGKSERILFTHCHIISNADVLRQPCSNSLGQGREDDTQARAKTSTLYARKTLMQFTLHMIRSSITRFRNLVGSGTSCVILG